MKEISEEVGERDVIFKRKEAYFVNRSEDQEENMAKAKKMEP